MLKKIIENIQFPQDHDEHETNFRELQLTLDVFQTEDELIVRAPLGGVKLSDINITVTDDVLTIRGDRKHEDDHVPSSAYYVQECYWGTFSRSIILPKNLQTDSVKAAFKNGILKISIAKMKPKTQVVPVIPHQ